jgi:hypothetical protein
MSSFVAVYDEFDAWDFYRMCTERIEDKLYCKNVARLVIELQAGQPYAYGRKMRVILPEYRRIAVAVDGGRRSAVVYLQVATPAEHGGGTPDGIPGHVETRRRGSVRVLALLYERLGDGFRLRRAEWMTPVTRAMRDLHPSAFFGSA